jgi:hypothetical protein
VALDDALDDGKADAGALQFTGPMQPLENSEKLVCILHIEACTVVFHSVEVSKRENAVIKVTGRGAR